MLRRLALPLLALTTFDATAQQTAPRDGAPTATPRPLQFVAEVETRLLALTPRDDGTAVLTLACGDLASAIEAGDEWVAGSADRANQLATGTVVTTSRAEPDSRRIHVHVRLADPEAAARLAEAVPAAGAKLPAFPSSFTAWSTLGAAKVTFTCTLDPAQGDAIGDIVRIEDPVTHERCDDLGRVPPHGSFVLRCREPLDLASVSAVQLVATNAEGESRVTVAMRCFAIDAAPTTLQFTPQLGMPLPAAIAAITGSSIVPPADYRLQIVGGPQGLRDASGATLTQTLELPFRIDRGALGMLPGGR